MVRSGLWVACALGLISVGFASGQSPADRTVAQTLRVQQALNQARAFLGQNDSESAIRTLESELPNIDGNAHFMALLRTAYTTRLQELQRTGENPQRVAQLQTQLQQLENRPSASGLRTPPPAPTPPEPDAPHAVAMVSEPAPVADPFQQTPAESNDAAPVSIEPSPVEQKVVDRQILDQAITHFDAKRYADALPLFRTAKQQGVRFHESEMQAWAYCRLAMVVQQLNAPGQPPLATLEAEVRDAMVMVPLTPSMRDFAENQVLAEILRRRGPNASSASAQVIPAGWNAVDSDNFRVLYRTDRPAAERVSQAAEASRQSTFEKWYGPTESWPSRCEVYLHDDAATFAKQTGKPATLPGMAKVTQRGKEVLNRRIDIRQDDPYHLTSTLPHQLAYIIQADLFGDQPPPRWACEAMAVLSEPPSQTARYLRYLPRCQEPGRFIHLAQLLTMAELPSGDASTVYYVESVALVDYLVRMKGSKAFTLFLIDGARYGYEKSLARQYGIRDFQELELKWLQHTALAISRP